MGPTVPVLTPTNADVVLYFQERTPAKVHLSRAVLPQEVNVIVNMRRTSSM